MSTNPQHFSGDETDPAWRLALKHQGLIVKLRQRFLNTPLDKEDLFQEGAIGLYIAARRFDPSRGIKFSTYATWWIQKMMQNYIRNNHLVHIPSWAHDYHAKATRIQLQQGISYEDAWEQLQKKGIARYIDPDTMQVQCSIDEITKHKEYQEPSETQAHPFLDEEVTHKLLSALSKTQRFIIEKRYGIHCDPMTLRQLSAILKVSPEAIRQAEARALEIMREEAQIAL